MQDLPEASIEKFSRVAKLLRTQRTLPARLEAVVAILKRTVPECDAAGISLLIEGEPTTTAVTDRLAVEVDLVQYETGEGPCLAAISDSNVIRMDVMEGDARFAHFAPGASPSISTAFCPSLWRCEVPPLVRSTSTRTCRTRSTPRPRRWCDRWLTTPPK